MHRLDEIGTEGSGGVRCDSHFAGIGVRDFEGAGQSDILQLIRPLEEALALLVVTRPIPGLAERQVVGCLVGQRHISDRFQESSEFLLFTPDVLM